MRRICERMVRQAAHQYEFTLLRILRQRLKKTRYVETLRLFVKTSSTYTVVHFRKFSCMSVEKRTIQTASWGEQSPDKLKQFREPPQQHSCSQDLLGVIPASTNDALSTVRLALREGRRGELREEGSCQGPSLSLSYLCGPLDNVVMPPHQYQPVQCESMRNETTSGCGFLRNQFHIRIHQTSFKYKQDEFDFATGLHL